MTAARAWRIAWRWMRQTRLARLAVMDIVPRLHCFEATDMRFALGDWHWFFLAQPHPGPERMIRADIGHWFRVQTSREPSGDGVFHANARADYLGRRPRRLPGCPAYARRHRGDLRGRLRRRRRGPGA